MYGWFPVSIKKNCKYAWTSKLGTALLIPEIAGWKLRAGTSPLNEPWE